MAKKPIKSRVTIMGHPIHPMLVHTPTTALIGLIASDIAFIITRDPFWAEAGFWLIAVGVIGGWLAAIVGFIDLISVVEIRRKVVGWCHSILAIALLALASFNWLIRFDDPGSTIIPWGVYISVLTGILLAVTANLGGHLVYRHAVGIDPK